VPDYLVQEEDGTSKLTLEDASGSLLLETFTAHAVPIADTVAVSDAVEAGFPRRVSQLPVEVLAQADDARIRVSQLPVEILVQGDSKARVSQLPVEILHRNLRETVAVVIWE
jgi:hypothetical protein